jgi:hypothetical protein
MTYKQALTEINSLINVSRARLSLTTLTENERIEEIEHLKQCEDFKFNMEANRYLGISN